MFNPSAWWVRLSVSELKRKSTLREVAIESLPVDDDEDLDALLSGSISEGQMIAQKSLLDDFDIPDDMSSDDWLLELTGSVENVEPNLPEEIAPVGLVAERDRLQKELTELRSQHEFECEYVDQLEQEVISVSTERDRLVTELTNQVTALQLSLQRQTQNQSPEPLQDDQDLSDRLAIHVMQLEEEFQQRLATALEIETQKVAQQYLIEISDKTELINQLQCQNTALDISQQTLTSELENTQVLLKESTKTLELAQEKLSEIKAQRDRFEEELIHHLSNQAQLHQSLRGLENEYVSDLNKVQELEQQIEDLQNQVLQRASKSLEYEAAIQHWKEQSVRHQHHALQLSGALDRLLAEKPIRHLTPPVNTQQDPDELISEREYKAVRSPESAPEPPSVRVPKRSPFPNSKVDLPAFLVRNR
ncbi:MAG: hypothetical protein AUK48_01320 [Oscillatoriales cyanobacterium CG2_30_44_21]|nr:MAG: hypothetical protein AUK48_01320 [Oscillatoriales cyanobacterium CG2_30_44_21]